MLSFLHIDLTQIVMTAGYAGLFCIIFAESGLFFGFFFPGDSLLFTAGLLSSQGFFNIWLLSPLLALAAILGDSAGYWFGARVGLIFFFREDSTFFHKKHLEQTRKFYEKYGSRAVVLARFVPIVRTFVPIFAGIATMPYRLFLIYNIVGGIVWSALCVLLGYFLGRAIPESEHYLLPITIFIIVISILPLVREYWIFLQKKII